MRATSSQSRSRVTRPIPGVAEPQGTNGTGPLPSQPILLNAIKETHTTSRYPPFPARVGQSGATQMTLSISSSGAVTDCEVVSSSGSEILDRVACRHVLDALRWRPPTQEGLPVMATTDATIVWKLENAQ